MCHQTFEKLNKNKHLKGLKGAKKKKSKDTQMAGLQLHAPFFFTCSPIFSTGKYPLLFDQTFKKIDAAILTPTDLVLHVFHTHTAFLTFEVV